MDSYEKTTEKIYKYLYLFHWERLCHKKRIEINVKNVLQKKFLNKLK